MKLKNIAGLSAIDIQTEADNGAKFVYYSYTISLLIISFKRTSNVFMIPAGESATNKGLPYNVLSLVFGWWGLPYGPIYTINSIRSNLKGGVDVTDDVMATVAGHLLFQEAEVKKIQEFK